ncbi:hypothetical protein H0H92_003205 [Tricholoma furcatifolium]|nr:hypothetical protein H0H92_003205 [Tricholoma furcatifolium]
MSSPAMKKQTIRLARLSDEATFLKEVSPAFLRAFEERRMEEFWGLLRILWNDRFPDPMKFIDGKPADYVENDAAVWQRQVVTTLDGYVAWLRANGEYRASKYDDWEEFMALESDRTRRRSYYFLCAEKFGEYLRGHQYDVVVSNEERAAVEVSPEEFSEVVWARLLAALLAAVKGG